MKKRKFKPLPNRPMTAAMGKQQEAVRYVPTNKARALQEKRMSRCAHCKGHYDFRREDYYVHDNVWADAGAAPKCGPLHVVCLEERLGRKLTQYDFPSGSVVRFWINLGVRIQEAAHAQASAFASHEGVGRLRDRILTTDVYRRGLIAVGIGTPESYVVYFDKRKKLPKGLIPSSFGGVLVTVVRTSMPRPV